MPGGVAVDLAGWSSYSSLLAAAGLADFKMAAVVREKSAAWVLLSLILMALSMRAKLRL